MLISPKESDSTEKSPKAVFFPHDPRMLIRQLCALHTRLCLLPSHWFQSVVTPGRSCSNLLLRGAVNWHASVTTPWDPVSYTLPPASDQGSLRAVLLWAPITLGRTFSRLTVCCLRFSQTTLLLLPSLLSQVAGPCLGLNVPSPTTPRLCHSPTFPPGQSCMVQS